jgi:hypothetical protein
MPCSTHKVSCLTWDNGQSLPNWISWKCFDNHTVLGTPPVGRASGPSVPATTPSLRAMQLTAVTTLFTAIPLASSATVKSKNTTLNSPRLKRDPTCLIGKLVELSLSSMYRLSVFFYFDHFMGPGATFEVSDIMVDISRCASAQRKLALAFMKR